MMVIECSDLSKVYGKTKALNNLSFSIEENKITGLIGRNGAGKTTLLKIITGFIKESSGEIAVFSEKPFNNIMVSANTILVDDQMTLPAVLGLGEILEVAESFYENWDMQLAERLFEYFSFHPNQSHSSLSKGKKSTFNMILGLASRCPLTIFDEPTTGMDAAVRSDFYRALLKDYIAHPRTIIISSHHLNEIEDLLEDVLLIKDGHKHLHMPIAELKELAIGIKGKAVVVNEWTENKEILFTKNSGIDDLYVVVKNDFTNDEIEKGRLLGLDFTTVEASDLCVYLTSKTKGGIDDVFK